MQAIVKNFRGIREAQINISQIALISGLNGAGKTSIARAVAAAATGKAIPYAKVTKKDCGVLLRQGTKAAMSAIGWNNGSTQVEWPKAEAHSTGAPPAASEIAVGVTDLISMPPKESLAYLINLLKAEPAEEDIRREFDAAGLEAPEKIAATVFDSIQKQGWDGAHARAKEKGSQLKGAWAQVTGTAYGKKKADEWYPEGWEDSLLKADHQSVLVGLRQQLEIAIGRSAVNKAEKERLQQLADQLPALTQEVADTAEALKKAEDAFKPVEERLRNTPNPDAKEEYACPHCKGAVHVSATSGSKFILTKAEKIDSEKLKQSRKEYAGLCGEKTRLENEVHAARAVHNKADRNRDEAAKAAEKLPTLGRDVANDSQQEVDELRARILDTEKHQRMVSQYTDAQKLAGQISTNQVIIDALDETGIRKTKLSECLDVFSAKYVDPLCKDFGIPSVLIDADMNIAMGEVTYPMLSASEQFRVKTVLQLAVAMLEQSSLVIIDGADILDKPSRGRLLNMLVKTKMPAVICMTLNKAESAPNLAQAGVGNTYWVENGLCRPVAGSTERAAA